MPFADQITDLIQAPTSAGDPPILTPPARQS